MINDLLDQQTRGLRMNVTDTMNSIERNLEKQAKKIFT